MQESPVEPSHEAVAEPTDTAPAERSQRGTRRELALAWGLGLIAGLVIVGPGLRPGSWFNLDLVVTPITPVPRGVWGLGPELPRRIPYALPMAWLSPLFDSTWVVKVMVVVSIAAAVAGAWRLAARWFDDLPWLARAGSGCLYGMSPFLLTRLGVGHLPLVVAMGLLPWALPVLLDPCGRPRAMFCWSLAIGMTGFLGGLLPLIIVGVALICAKDSIRARVAPLLLVVVSQMTWLVPGAVVLVQGAAPGDASDFRTSTQGAGGALRVLAGQGFWNQPSQVGGNLGWQVPVIGVVLVGLALVGIWRLPSRIRRPAVAVAAVGLGIALASALPLVRRGYEVLVDSPVSAILREGQRLLPLYLVVLAPAAAGGAARLGALRPGWRDGLALAVPLAAAVVLAGPGLWGVHGDLAPVRLPAAWANVRRRVHAGGGTTLSLPFYEYTYLGVAKNRDTLDPMPIYLGGDVLSSSNPELSGPSEERADPREASVTKMVDAMRHDRPVAAQLARAGIHWVVLRHDDDWDSYLSLHDDPGFREVVSSSTIDLFEDRDWRGVVVTAAGAPTHIHQLVGPLAYLDTSSAVVWNRPGLSGWMRGTHAAKRGPDGVIELPAGSGPVWYWPTVVVLLGDLVVAITALGAWRAAWQARPADLSGPHVLARRADA